MRDPAQYIRWRLTEEDTPTSVQWLGRVAHAIILASEKAEDSLGYKVKPCVDKTVWVQGC